MKMTKVIFAGVLIVMLGISLIPMTVQNTFANQEPVSAESEEENNTLIMEVLDEETGVVAEDSSQTIETLSISGNVTSMEESDDTYYVYFDTDWGIPKYIDPIQVNYGDIIMNHPSFPPNDSIIRQTEFGARGYYIFKGWKVEKPRGNSGNASIQDLNYGKLLTKDDTMPDHDVYLTAQWKFVNVPLPITAKMTVNKNKIGEGEELKYTVTVKNVSKDKVTHIQLKGRLPEYTTFVSSDLNRNPEKEYDGAYSITWAIRPLEPGEEATINYTARTAAKIPSGHIFKNSADYICSSMTYWDETNQVKTKYISNHNPQTGDKDDIFLPCIIAMIAAILALSAVSPLIISSGTSEGQNLCRRMHAKL